MRKLASVQRIINIEPIKNADSIEVVSVLGWKVVAKKGDFQVGDLVIYFEIDSILPKLPEFDFMEKHSYILRTIRMQGLCWVADTLPRGLEIYEGLDVTELPCRALLQ
jgi:RNA ligase (TIGR02306 family)